MFGLVSKAKYQAVLAENTRLLEALDTKNQVKRARVVKASEPAPAAPVEAPAEAPVAKPNTKQTTAQARKAQANEMKAAGKTVQEIANELGVKDSTIQTYLRGEKDADKGSN